MFCPSLRVWYEWTDRVLETADVIDFDGLSPRTASLTKRRCGVGQRAFCAASRTRSEAADSRSQGDFPGVAEARRREISETLPGEYFLTAWQLLISFLL